MCNRTLSITINLPTPPKDGVTLHVHVGGPSDPQAVRKAVSDMLAAQAPHIAAAAVKAVNERSRRRPSTAQEGKA